MLEFHGKYLLSGPWREACLSGTLELNKHLSSQCPPPLFSCFTHSILLTGFTLLYFFCQMISFLSPHGKVCRSQVYSLMNFDKCIHLLINVPIKLQNITISLENSTLEPSLQSLLPLPSDNHRSHSWLHTFILPVTEHTVCSLGISLLALDQVC